MVVLKASHTKDVSVVILLIGSRPDLQRLRNSMIRSHMAWAET